MTSKQPRRSDLTSDLKSVTSATYLSVCILPHGLDPFVASEATTASKTASEVRSDLRFGIYSPNSICYHVCLESLDLFWPFF